MNFNFNETYFLENLATRPRSRPKIAQIEVFDHFLDFASLVFLILQIMIGQHYV